MLDGRRANTLSTSENNGMLRRVCEKRILKTKQGSFALNRKQIQGVDLLLLHCHILRNSCTKCFVVSVTLSSRSSHDVFLFLFTSAVICSNKQGDLREAETRSDRNRADRDYMLHYKNDNNRVEAAVEFRWLSVGLLNALF